ncbi:hypothetical protein OAL66_02080 [bacterium]|nr:hypothetical protein [bacterium]
MRITYFAPKEAKGPVNRNNLTAYYKSLFFKLKSAQRLNQKDKRDLVFENLTEIIEKIKINIVPYSAINDDSIDLYLSSPISIIDCQAICDFNTIFSMVYFASMATEVGGALFVTTSKEYIYSIKSLAGAYFESNGFSTEYVDIEKRIIGFTKQKKNIPLEYINNEIF